MDTLHNIGDSPNTWHTLNVHLQTMIKVEPLGVREGGERYVYKCKPRACPPTKEQITQLPPVQEQTMQINTLQVYLAED